MLYEALTDCKRFPIFPPRFSDIPRKISAYLRTESPSGANMRIMRCFHNTLNINNLNLRDILSLCEKHHFGMRNGPFQRPKCTISHLNMGFFVLRNWLYQKSKRTFPDYVMGYIKMLHCPKCPLSYTI